MPKIINIKDRIAGEKQNKLDTRQQRLREALQKFLQCSHCMMKCSRCGVQITVSTPSPLSTTIPFRLCETCEEEYLEYQQSMKDKKNHTIPWQNQKWKKMWNFWIEYQQALKEFQNSKEVRDLFNDFKK